MSTHDGYATLPAASLALAILPPSLPPQSLGAARNRLMERSKWITAISSELPATKEMHKRMQQAIESDEKASSATLKVFNDSTAGMHADFQRDALRAADDGGMGMEGEAPR